MARAINFIKETVVNMQVYTLDLGIHSKLGIYYFPILRLKHQLGIRDKSLSKHPPLENTAN